MYVLLNVFNPNKQNKLSPIKKFLLEVSEDDDDVLARLKTIDGAGFYYKPQAIIFAGTEFGKETMFYGEPREAQKFNLMWFATLCGGYDAKWSEVGENLKRNIGVPQFADVTKATEVSIDGGNVHCLTVIAEFLK